MRYMLFFGLVYYPLGGFEDYQGSYSCIEEAEAEATAKAEEFIVEWWHIVDKQTMTMVKKWRCTDYLDEVAGG